MPFRVEYADDSTQVDQEKPTFRAQADESYPAKFARGIPRAAARTVEAGIGLPKAIGEGIQSLGNLASRGAQAITPEFIQQAQEFDPMVSLGLKSGPTPEEQEEKRSFPFGRDIPFLPSSETVKENITEPLSQLVTGQKGALEPQSEPEKFFDEIVTDAVPFLFGTGKASAASKVARAFGVSAAGNLSKLGSMTLGGASEGTGNLIKAGTMFATSLFGPKSSKDYASELYNESEANIPKNEKLSFDPLKKAMRKVRVKMVPGADKKLDKSKEYVRDFFDNISAKSDSKNKIKVSELPAFKKLYNEDFGANRVPKRAQGWMHDFFESYDDAYKTAPKSVLPEIEKLKTADNIYSAIHAQNKIEKFISDDPTLNSLFKKGAKFSGLGFLFNPKSAAGGLGAFKVYDFIEKFATYPGLQKRYGEVFNSLFKKDPIAVAKNFSLLTKEYDKKSAPKPSQGKFRVVSV